MLLFSESKRFNYFDPPDLVILNSNCPDPLDDQEVVDFIWFNSSIFKIEYFEVSYKEMRGRILVRGREYEGNVTIIENGIYFFPDDAIAIGEQFIDAIQFQFYGKCFKYFLDFNPVVVNCRKQDMSFHIQEMLDFIEGNTFYAANAYEYEGIYRIE